MASPFPIQAIRLTTNSHHIWGSQSTLWEFFPLGMVTSIITASSPLHHAPHLPFLFQQKPVSLKVLPPGSPTLKSSTTLLAATRTPPSIRVVIPLPDILHHPEQYRIRSASAILLCTLTGEPSILVVPLPVPLPYGLPNPRLPVNSGSSA